MNLRKAYLFVFLILLIDQASKIYIKTNFYINEQVKVFDWFRIYFVENEGMAWGAEIPGDYGKLILTLFRIIAVGGISWWLFDSIKKGLSNYLKKCFPNEELKVAIAYDCRKNSDTLAKIVADIFSANNIKVYLFSELRPTPELSFALKHLNCHAGIVLTASHNPPEYNGYKVYWQDGGQIVPPQDAEIIAEIEALKYSDILFSANESLIEYIDEAVDVAFINSTIENASFNTPKSDKENLNIVFTHNSNRGSFSF